MCLPIASTVAEVIQSADQQCIVGLLAKMGKLYKNIIFSLSSFILMITFFFIRRQPQLSTGLCSQTLVTHEMHSSMCV